MVESARFNVVLKIKNEVFDIMNTVNQLIFADIMFRVFLLQDSLNNCQVRMCVHVSPTKYVNLCWNSI